MIRVPIMLYQNFKYKEACFNELLGVYGTLRPCYSSLKFSKAFLKSKALGGSLFTSTVLYQMGCDTRWRPKSG